MKEFINELQSRYLGGAILSHDDPKTMKLGFLLNGDIWLTVDVIEIRQAEFYAGEPIGFSEFFRSAEKRSQFASEVEGYLATALKDKHYFEQVKKAAAEQKQREINDALEMDDLGDRWEDLMI